MSVLASSLAFIDGSVLNVALPAIAASYHADAASVQWVVNAFTLPLSALLLLGGGLGDHYGRRICLVIGTALFGLASLLCALAPGLPMLLTGRALQGVGAALLLPNSLALLNGAYHGAGRGRAVGIWAAAGAISAAGAPLLGGWLVGRLGWPTIFYINLPLVAGAIAIALLKVAEVRDEASGRIDYAGAALATAALGVLTYGLTRWSSARQFDGWSAGGMIVGVLLMVAFVMVEHRRGARAMMPTTLFGTRAFAGLNLMTFLLYGAFGGMMLIIPYVLIAGAHYSPVAAGAALLPLPILIAVGSPIMGGVAERTGARLPLTVGPLIVAGGMLLGLRIAPDQGYWVAVFPAIAVMAAGMALAVAPLTSTVLGSVDAQHTGVASGFNSAVSRGGGLIATALLGGVLALTGDALFGGLHGALIVGAATAAAAGVCALVSVARKDIAPA